MLILYHDWGSAANAGVFSISFLKYFSRHGGAVWSFLHKDYPLFGSNIFKTFGYFDNGRFSTVSKVFQILFTLSVMLSVTWFRYLIGRETRVIINIYQPFTFYYFFARCCPKNVCLPVVHDVITHKNSISPVFQVSINKFIYEFPCIFLSESSLELLPAKAIKRAYVLPFPLFDSSIFRRGSENPSEAGLRVCFLGHLRREKGIELILNALRGVHLQHVSVVIHGTNPFGYDISLEEFPSISFIPQFVPSSDYYEYLQSFDYCMLMYDDSVSNSGVLYDCLSVGVRLITSNAPLFTKSDLREIFQICESAEDLREFILEIDKTQRSVEEHNDSYKRTLNVYEHKCYMAYEKLRRDLL